MSGLIDVQRTFAAVLQRPGAEAPMHAQLKGDAARNADLLAVYRGNAVANTHKALQLAYPVIEQIVGDEFFAALARAYRDAHPSRSGDLNEYGEAFADFLAGFEHVADMPYLPDMARIEWGVAQAAVAADYVALQLPALAEISPDAVAEAGFVLQPALCLMASAWPLASIWQQHQPTHEGEISIDLAVAECAAVHRVGLRVEVMRLQPAERVFWMAAQQGENLGEMLDRAFEQDAEFDVQGCLARGFGAEFIVELIAEPTQEES